MKNLELISTPQYGIIENGIWGTRIVSGIVTGIRYTEEQPVYELSFGKDKYWASEVTEKVEDLIKILKLKPLEQVKQTHGLKIKYS